MSKSDASLTIFIKTYKRLPYKQFSNKDRFKLLP